MKKYYSMLLLFLLSTATVLSADNVVVLEDYSITGTALNTTVLADQANWTGGNSTTYVLRKGGTYVWNAQVGLPTTSNISFQSDYGAGDPEAYPNQNLNPKIYGYGGASPWLNITADGVKLSFKNINISGYNEQDPTTLSTATSGTLIRCQTSGGSNTRIIFDSCIVKTISAQVVRTESSVGLIKFTNCMIADQGHPSSNFGAGKFIDARNIKVDTIWVESNTFVNYYDRIIRHYQAPTGQYIGNFIFNHNTVLSSMSYHGFLSLGRVKDDAAGGTFQIKNNLLVDHFALGMDTANVRQSEFGDPAELDRYGRYRLAWVLTNKNDSVQWDIQKNYYAVSDSGQAMLNLGANPAYFGPLYQSCDKDSIGGNPNDYNFLTRNMNKILALQGKDTINTFQKVTLKIAKDPGLMTEMIRWVLNGSLDAKNKPTLNASPIWLNNGSPDMHRTSIEYYADTLDCDFRCNVDLSVAGTDGKIIGDTRWSYLGLVGVNNIAAQVPSEYSLTQNYPNPFNPSTSFTYELSKAGFVSVKVFDLLGREVATLVNEFKPAGSYPASWNAAGFGSGVYFYKMQSGSFVATKKMILMK